MPEYLVQDGSSCSYEEQSLGDSSLNKIGIEDTSSNTPDHDQKPDITQTFYSSNQSTSDSLDLKHQTADVGHLLSKPSTSGERLTQEAVQGGGGTQSEACWRYNWSSGDAGSRAFFVQTLRKRLQAPCFADPAPRSASQPDYLHSLPYHSQS
uniref:Uncharacterized protein n=1 Tax=Apis cerana TaxID=7461 RepID=V9IAH4_APICE